MPTDNPKISLYVPQQVYDLFKSFQEERELSMSQAGIVILAEYFGIQETIKEFTEGTTVGGVTLDEFKQLQKRVSELEIVALMDSARKVDLKETISKPLSKNQSTEEKTEPLARRQNQLELIEENPISISVELLAKRIGSRNPKSVRNKKSEVYKNNNPKADSEFYEWSQKRDLDNIGWKPISEGIKVKYIPVGELPGSLLGKLQNWIAENG